MWRKPLAAATGRALRHPWRTTTFRQSTTASSAVNSLLLRSLKDHYLEVSRMSPPAKVSPPAPFTVVKGSLDGNGPVLKRSYGNDEEINVSVMRLANIVPGGGGEDDGDDSINQLFVHVDVSKPGQPEHVHFLCGLYPDALGIHSISMRPKAENSGFLVVPNQYAGPVFQDLDESMRDALHSYIEERGINESLFPFLQAWLYVKDHRNLMHWFKSVGTFIHENKAAKDS
ncbi:uncharacterized protein At2g39795, mitochondrial [Alnus glutinosa]|uniref:uncharacterized protein At2g39795, mitochondrial n=1 Tax=Alnus glutinosa TaxID=3517 RepID=UPI002D76AB08|nr:uncharacterized protein At2g39795, mitochondrial [Alnus glutinosa]